MTRNLRNYRRAKTTCIISRTVKIYNHKSMVFVMVLLCINAKNQQEIISKMRTNTAEYNRNFSFGTLYYVNDMV